MYGLVNLCSGKTSTYEDIQTNYMSAYPSSHQQRQYLKGSHQQQRNNNVNNNILAIELYEQLVNQFIGGGNHNGW